MTIWNRKQHKDPWVDCSPGKCGKGWCESQMTSFASYPLCSSLKEYEKKPSDIRRPDAPKPIPGWRKDECDDWDSCDYSGYLSANVSKEGCGVDRPCTFIANKGRLLAGFIHDSVDYPHYNLSQDMGKMILFLDSCRIDLKYCKGYADSRMAWSVFCAFHPDSRRVIHLQTQHHPQLRRDLSPIGCNHPWYVHR